jgi:hypothetical protein
MGYFIFVTIKFGVFVVAFLPTPALMLLLVIHFSKSVLIIIKLVLYILYLPTGRQVVYSINDIE